MNEIILKRDFGTKMNLEDRMQNNRLNYLGKVEC